MNQDIWNNWMNKINWVLDIAKRKRWEYSELVVEEPVSESDFEVLENDLKIKYPLEFKEILTTYSSGVHFKWQIEGDETEGEFRQIFRGAGKGYLWDFQTLRTDYEKYQRWVKECFSDPDDEYDSLWHNKVPFLDVANGDIIAFGEQTKDGSPVVYLSHDGGDFHGQILGNNFVDFIDKWTQIGCVGTEDWQFEPFYDYETKEFLSNKLIHERWVNWLEK